MAIPVARVHLATAHAALPALLPTPPKSSMLPRLAPPCVLILPMSPPKLAGGRADATAVLKSSSKPGRADAAQRWDAHKIKIKPSSPASPCSTQRSSSGSSSNERWDAKKKGSSDSNRSSSSSSSARWDSTKRAINCSSSAQRWDAHKNKKPCPPQSTGKSNGTVLGMLQRPFYSGPGFTASPQPCMLPMPLFIVRVA